MGQKILFLHQSWMGFEKRDYEIIKNNFSSEEILIYRNFWYKTLFAVRKIIKADIIFCWFAYRSALLSVLLAKVFKKKIIIAVGGWDAASVPEIHYGVMRPGVRFLLTRLITKYLVTLADRILASSEFGKSEIIKNLRVSPKKITVLFLGASSNCCTKDEICDKKEMILTVAAITESNLVRKGLRDVIEVARLLPGKKFVLCGTISKKIRIFLNKIIPRNLQIVKFSEESVHDLYRRAKVYVQLSYYETFGLALAEAMVHECVPVVTGSSALPEVAGNTAYYVPYGDLEKIAQAITHAVNDNQKGKMARQRVINFFSLENREKRLLGVIQDLTAG
ncbi:MAG: glycosyltransferase family 4 protein [Omnitrophica bacterium]|nr:glycosyltransferase family 4 protein [Candidatus Omnitrophota bacterium]